MATALAWAAANAAWAWSSPEEYCCACSTVAAPFADQPLIALVLLLGEGERGLRLRHLLVGLVDARLLRGDLGFDVGDIGGRLIDLRLGLIELRLVVAVVEPHQHGAGLDRLVVGHRHVDDGGADLRADRHRARIDEGVVGGFVIAGVEPPDREQRRWRR